MPSFLANSATGIECFWQNSPMTPLVRISRNYTLYKSNLATEGGSRTTSKSADLRQSN